MHKNPPPAVKTLGALHRKFWPARILRKSLIALRFKPDRIIRGKGYIDTIRLAYGTPITLWLDDHVDLAIWLFGYYERVPTYAFRSLLKRGDVVLDIGANIGYYSLLTHDIAGPQGKVYAFEPVSKTFERLAQNTRNFANILCHKNACGNTAGKAQIYLADSTCTAGSRMSQPFSGNGKRQDVESINIVRLDDTIPNAKVDVVKIDVEGYEANVLKGMGGIISKNPQIKVFLEMNKELLQMAGSNPEEVFAIMNEHGLAPWELHTDNNKLRIISQKEYFGDYNMILFAKKEFIPREYL